MTRTEAVARVAEGVGFRTDLDARIISYLQEAQRDLERGKTLPRFLLLEDQTLSLASGAQNVTLPTGFLREDDNALPRYTPTGATVPYIVKKRGMNEAIEAYGGATASGPKIYVLRNSTLRFYPTSDRAYTLTWNYYKAAVTLNNDVENLWLANAPEWLIGEAGVRLAQSLRDQDAAAIFDVIRTAGRAATFADDIARDLAGPPISMGSAN